MDYIKIATEILRAESKALETAALQNIDSTFSDVVALILNTPGKIIVTGVGKSGLIGGKIAATFSCIGISSFFLHPTDAIHGDLGMIDKNDAIFIVSYSGETEEILKLLPHIKRLGVPIIAMTRSQHSTLAKYADLFLTIRIEKEAGPLNLIPTSSTTLAMAMGDAIAVCLMRSKMFTRKDLAGFHPGGSLGKVLYAEQKKSFQQYAWQTSHRKFGLEGNFRELLELIDKLLSEQLSLAGIARVTGVSEIWLQHYVNKKSARHPQQREETREKIA